MRRTGLPGAERFDGRIVSGSGVTVNALPCPALPCPALPCPALWQRCGAHL
ncbi:hypothetical protein ATKI12_8490 [Kitasatospora sp. Ki12]